MDFTIEAELPVTRRGPWCGKCRKPVQRMNLARNEKGIKYLLLRCHGDEHLTEVSDAVLAFPRGLERLVVFDPQGSFRIPRDTLFDDWKPAPWDSYSVRRNQEEVSRRALEERKQAEESELIRRVASFNWNWGEKQVADTTEALAYTKAQERAWLATVEKIKKQFYVDTPPPQPMPPEPPKLAPKVFRAPENKPRQIILE